VTQKREIALTTEAMLKEARSFHTKKRLGQHFLVDASALQAIAETSACPAGADATAGDTVLEIGPGAGFLTRFLLAEGVRVIAIDLDRDAIRYLESRSYPNLQLVHGDFLQMDLRSVADGQRFKVVGNVPYQITGLILGHLLGEIGKPSPWLGRIDSIVVTVQKEVAERMVATPGSKDYSQVSLLVEYFCRPSIEIIIPPESFFPRPKVTSAVVRLIPSATPRVQCGNHTLLRQVIKAGFKQRRKMLRNNLSFLRAQQEEIDQLFAKLSLDPQVRAERLSLQQFAMLTDAIDQLGLHRQYAEHHVAGTGKNQSDA
jgi:16S rRNA (adenine1518-N6/adenine1519-N6)-dimethyltransferase